MSHLSWNTMQTADDIKEYIQVFKRFMNKYERGQLEL